jgi:hypothetical protein
MADVIQIIIGILFLALVFIASRFGIAWRIKRACSFVIRDLDHRKAIDYASAVELPYAKTEWLRMGLRDFRPKAVQGLVQAGVIGITPEGKYFLNKRIGELEKFLN